MPFMLSSPMMKLPGSRDGMAFSFEFCESMSMFCRNIDTPIAEISGIRRLPPRSGR